MGHKIEYVDDFTVYECMECGEKLYTLVGEDPPDECPYCTGKATSEKMAIGRLINILIDQIVCPTDPQSSKCDLLSKDICRECWHQWAMRVEDAPQP